MSEMSFKQAKELVERLELTEVSIKKATNDLNKSSLKFRESLKKQALIVKLMPQTDKKLNVLRLLLALNVGIIIGFIAGVYFIK
jgi:hypothetical protein